MSAERAIGRGERLRKAVHIGCGLFALLLRWLPAWGAMLMAVAALLFNALLLPRLTGHALERDGERLGGKAWGIIFYALSVLILIAVFHDRLELAAAAWGIMAFGDGLASLVGRLFPRPRLPWNAAKSVAGSAAFVVCGGIGGWALLLFCGREGSAVPGPLAALGMVLVAAVVAGLFESLPAGLDDNLSVPLAAGATLWALALVDRAAVSAALPVALARLPWALAVNGLLGLAAWRARAVNLSGLIAGCVLGSAIFVGLGAAGFITLLTFFVLGTGTTRVGFAAKEAAGLAQARGGRRGAENALANAGAGAALALLAATTPYGPVMVIAFVAAFATAAFDTVSSEIGQVYGRHPVLITTLRPVPPGTEGAVSLEGSAAGILASAVVAGVAVALGLLPVPGVAPVLIGAFVGAMAESYLGATLEAVRVLDNELVNFLNTIVGAGVAVLAARLLGSVAA